ncbi:RhoGAP domain protein [Trichuris suis]|nr:RhoGAP domain protein [Trichuris suis]
MYANLITGECCWQPPSGARVKRTHENQWWELYDQNTGRFYYCNAFTQKTVWQRPHNCDIIPLAKLQTLKLNTEARRTMLVGGTTSPVQADGPSRIVTYDEPPFSFPPEPIHSPSTGTGTTSSSHSPHSSRSCTQTYGRTAESRSVSCQTQTSPGESPKPSRRMSKNKSCTSVSCQTALSSSHLLKKKGQQEQLHRGGRSRSRTKRSDCRTVSSSSSTVHEALIKSLNHEKNQTSLKSSAMKSNRGIDVDAYRISCGSVANLASTTDGANRASREVHDDMVSSVSSYSLKLNKKLAESDPTGFAMNRLLLRNDGPQEMSKRSTNSDVAFQSMSSCGSPGTTTATAGGRLPKMSQGSCSTPARRRILDKSPAKTCSVIVDSTSSSDQPHLSCANSKGDGKNDQLAVGDVVPQVNLPNVDDHHWVTAAGKINRQRSFDFVAGHFPMANIRVRMPATKSFRSVHTPVDNDKLTSIKEQKMDSGHRSSTHCDRTQSGGVVRDLHKTPVMPIAAVAGSQQLWKAVDCTAKGAAGNQEVSESAIWKSHDSGIRSCDSYPRGDDSSSQASADSPRLCDSGHPSTNGSITKSPNLPLKLSLAEGASKKGDKEVPSSLMTTACTNPVYEHVTQHLTYSQLHQQFIVGNTIDPFSEQELDSTSSEESERDEDEELFADDEEGGPHSPTSLTSSQDDEEYINSFKRFTLSAKMPSCTATIPRSVRLPSSSEEVRSPIYDMPDTPTKESVDPSLYYTTGAVDASVLFRRRTSEVGSSVRHSSATSSTPGADSESTVAIGKQQVDKSRPSFNGFPSEVSPTSLNRPQSVVVPANQQQQQQQQADVYNSPPSGPATLNRLTKVSPTTGKGGDDSRLTGRTPHAFLREGDIEFYAHEYLNKHTKGLFRKRQSVQSVLSWTRNELKKPLIMTSDKSLKKEACEIFKRIQAYMGDRKVRKSGVTLDQLALDVCVRGWAKPALRDEIFLQLCKQATENPRPESSRRGWELLSICLKFFPPSALFTSYLESHISRYASPMFDLPEVALSHYAQHCCKRLERIVRFGARRGLRKPTIEEIEQARLQIFHPSMFGNTLEEVMLIQRERFARRKLPWIQTTLSELVLQLNGARTEGIFRVPGDIDEVNALKMRVDRWLLPPVNDPHVPASLLKLWYRELADPLVPDRMYDECIQSAADPDKCCKLIDQLPPINRLVIAYLIRFLQTFIRPENVALTKMDSNNLAMVMAPNCLRCQSEDPNAFSSDDNYATTSWLRRWLNHLISSPSHASITSRLSCPVSGSVRFHKAHELKVVGRMVKSSHFQCAFAGDHVSALTGVPKGETPLASRKLLVGSYRRFAEKEDTYLRQKALRWAQPLHVERERLALAAAAGGFIFYFHRREKETKKVKDIFLTRFQTFDGCGSMSFFSALRWMLGFGAHLLYLILRLLFGAFKGAKEVGNVGTSIDEEKRTTGNEPHFANVLKQTAQTEGTFSSRMNIASGELFYPGGLIDRKMPEGVSRPTHRAPISHPVVQVGRETVHIQLRGTRRRILSSDSSAEEEKQEEERKCPTGGCAPEVKSLFSSRVVVPLSNVTSERTLTTIEKREERKADVRLSVLSKKTELDNAQEALAPFPEAVRYDRAPKAEPLAASTGRPLKSHRDQVLEQVRKCRSIVQALTTTSAGGLSKAQRMFSSRKLRAASAPWANRASGGDEVRPENCQKLSRCLTSETQPNERGVAMFMRQRQRADKYTIDEETPRRTPLPRSFAPTPTRPTALQPMKIRPDELLESVRAAANRREQTMNKPVPHGRRSTSVEPDRHRWTGIISPFDYAIGAQTPSSYELSTTKTKGVRFMNGPVNSATEPLYIQCYDRPSADYSRPSAASQTMGPNFNSLPRGWKSYKANLKAPSLR